MGLNQRIELVRTDWQDLGIDSDLFLDIQSDARENAEFHTPITAWLERGGGGEQSNHPSRYSFEYLLEGWSGFGRNRINDESLYWWIEPLAQMDVLGLVDRYFSFENKWHCKEEHFTVSDLGVIWGINIVVSYLESFNVKSPTVVEVGAGYGRLAEAFFSVYDSPIKYIIIDSVPASLMYAYVYLKKALVGKKVGIFYRDQNIEDYDCFIIPSWHFERINPYAFDLAINIQSMQEMYQHHVDYYLKLLNQITRKGGVIYLCNRRDHRFRGNWNVPVNWQCLLKCMCPRSWIREFPTEVYLNGEGDFGPANKLIDAQYQRAWTYAAAKRLEEAKQLKYRAY